MLQRFRPDPSCPLQTYVRIDDGHHFHIEAATTLAPASLACQRKCACCLRATLSAAPCTRSSLVNLRMPTQQYSQLAWLQRVAPSYVLFPRQVRPMITPSLHSLSGPDRPLVIFFWPNDVRQCLSRLCSRSVCQGRDARSQADRFGCMQRGCSRCGRPCVAAATYIVYIAFKASSCLLLRIVMNFGRLSTAKTRVFPGDSS